MSLNYGGNAPYYLCDPLSTKPEVHNVSHCRQKRTCTEKFGNVVKLGRAVFEIRDRIDSHADRLIAMVSSPPAGEVMNVSSLVMKDTFVQ